MLRSLAAVLAVLAVVPARAETPVPVGVALVEHAPVANEIALNGSLVARRVSRLSAEIDGLVAGIDVDDGDAVAAGDVIVTLDRRMAAIARDAARARLDEARARHAESIRRHAELQALRDKRHIAETEVQAAAAMTDINAAQVRQAEAEAARAAENLARHTVHAPFDAVVRRKLVETGEWIETSTAIVELVDVAVLRLEVAVPQFYFNDVTTGSGATVRLDALPERSFAASVSRVIPVGDPASRTFRVWIDIPNENGALAPGMSARVKLRAGDDADKPSVVLPRDAVVRHPDGRATVWVVTEDDGITRAEQRDVALGRTYRQFVEVLDGGLRPGQQVVTRGNEILRPGQSVRVADGAGDI